MRGVQAVLLAAAAAAVSCNEVRLMGEHDWMRSHVGDVQLAVPAHRLLVTSVSQGAVAGISSRSGDMKWRQVLQKGASLLLHSACHSEHVSSFPCRLTGGGVDILGLVGDCATSPGCWELPRSSVEGK